MERPPNDMSWYPKPWAAVLGRTNSQPIPKSRLFTLYSSVLILSFGAIFLSFASILNSTLATHWQVPSLPNVSNLDMFVEVILIDPMERTIAIDWYPTITVSEINCSEYMTSPFVREFYIPQAVLDMSSPGWTLSPPYPPLFVFNGTEYCLDMNDLQIHRPSFRTITKLIESKDTDLGRILSSLKNYPFDVYTAPLSISVRDPYTDSKSAPRVTQLFPMAVNFQVSLVTQFVQFDRMQNSQLVIDLEITRSKAVQAFAIAVAISNWFAVATFLMIMASTFVYESPKIYSEMFVVPVGTLFAFSSIRANLPGAPVGFGTTVDMYSILPVLIILSLCGFALLLIVLYRRIIRITSPKSGVRVCMYETKQDCEDITVIQSSSNSISSAGHSQFGP